MKKLPFFILFIVLLIAATAVFKIPRVYSQTTCNDQDRINCIQTSGNFWSSQLCACFYTGMSCSIGNALCNASNTQSCIDMRYDSCTSYQTGSGSGYAEENRCCYNNPTPTPSPTPSPEPCITYGTTGDLSYPNTCSGTNGFYTDKCNGNQTIIYSCNSSGACQSFTSACNAGETCVEEPANGLTHCVAVPTPAPGVVAQEEQCNSAGTAWVAVATNVCVAGNKTIIDFA